MVELRINIAYNHINTTYQKRHKKKLVLRWYEVYVNSDTECSIAVRGFVPLWYEIYYL